MNCRVRNANVSCVDEIVDNCNIYVIRRHCNYAASDQLRAVYNDAGLISTAGIICRVVYRNFRSCK